MQPQEHAGEHHVASLFDSRCLQRGIPRGQEKELGQLFIVFWGRSWKWGQLAGSHSVKWELVMSLSSYENVQHFQQILRSSISEWERTPIQNSPTEFF